MVSPASSAGCSVLRISRPLKFTSTSIPVSFVKASTARAITVPCGYASFHIVQYTNFALGFSSFFPQLTVHTTAATSKTAATTTFLFFTIVLLTRQNAALHYKQHLSVITKNYEVFLKITYLPLYNAFFHTAREKYTEEPKRKFVST